MKIINTWISQINNHSVIPIFGDIEINDGKIISITQKEFNLSNLNQPSKPDDINAGGRVSTIPNVNFHDHIYSRLAKGLNIKGDTSNFPNILKHLWWKLDSLLDLEMIEASAKIAAVESIRNGVTYIIDHHSSPYSSENSLRTISKVLNELKLRSVLCFETTDRNGKKLSDLGLKENVNFLTDYSSADSKSLLGLHASFTLDDETLSNASELVQKYDWGVHIHLCEDISDVTLSKESYQSAPVSRLSNFNLLNERSIVAHGIHLQSEEFEEIKKSGSAMVFNLDSNMNNSVGLQKFKLIPDEIPILTGTDGMHSNSARAYKELFLQIRNAGLSFEEAFNFMIRTYFNQYDFIKNIFTDFSSLNIGDRADLIIWDYVPPTPLNEENYWGHYIYGILERQIKTVVQNGNILMDDFARNNIDESKILTNIYLQGEKLFHKFNEAE